MFGEREHKTVCVCVCVFMCICAHAETLRESKQHPTLSEPFGLSRLAASVLSLWLLQSGDYNSWLQAEGRGNHRSPVILFNHSPSRSFSSPKRQFQALCEWQSIADCGTSGEIYCPFEFLKSVLQGDQLSMVAQCPQGAQKSEKVFTQKVVISGL